MYPYNIHVSEQQYEKYTIGPERRVLQRTTTNDYMKTMAQEQGRDALGAKVGSHLGTG